MSKNTSSSAFRKIDVDQVMLLNNVMSVQRHQKLFLAIKEECLIDNSNNFLQFLVFNRWFFLKYILKVPSFYICVEFIWASIHKTTWELGTHYF
jgi:hypothetical protein